MWEDLKSISHNMNDPWLVAGNFNDIMHQDEKVGGALIAYSICDKFKKRIEYCRLMDMGVVGPKYTRRGTIFNGGEDLWAFGITLWNEKWRLLYHDGYVKVLPRLNFLDHHPLLIRMFGNVLKEPNFRFESAWLVEEDYYNTLMMNWKDNQHIHTNFKNLKQGIKSWKLRSFKQVIRHKNEILRCLKGIQRNIQVGNRVGGLRRLEMKPQNEISDILKQE